MGTSSDETPASEGSLRIQPRTIPLPAAASPELRKWIIQQVKNMPTILKGRAFVPKTVQEWRTVLARSHAFNVQLLAQVRRAFPLNVERQTVAGVTTYSVAPEVIPAENRNRVLVSLHGGAYIAYGGEVTAWEAILMAHHARTRTIAVDYRMPPDHPFPAALDDSIAVWKEVIKTHRPENTGLHGTSAGGGLALATVLKLKELGLPLPGAVSAGTPWIDLSGKNSDTLYTNEYVDDLFVILDGFGEAAAKLYAGNCDARNPLISPIYGDFEEFPPVILTSGTRDLLLSDTVRAYRRLRQAGVEARLQVFEGLSHAEYMMAYNSQESKEAYKEISLFFDEHLGR